MMGSSGSPPDLKNTISDAALGAISSMLEIIANPAVAKETLTALAAKSVELKAQLKDLDTKQEAITNTQKGIFEKQEKANSALKDLAAKEVEIKNREAQVAKASEAHAARHAALTARETELAAYENALSEKKAAIDKHVQDTSTKVDSMVANAKQEINDRKTTLEASYGNIIANANAAHAQANKKNSDADIKLADAEKLKTLYEKRIASLKQLVQE